MEVQLRLVLLLCCFRLAALSNSSCIIELECAECIPDNMAVVTSHRAAGGLIEVRGGDEALLDCAPATFLQYPLRTSLSVMCEAGRFRVVQDGTLRHILDLGCQENIFEDVLHDVEYCASSYQGRSYQIQTHGGGARHLATVCFDADAGVTLHAAMTAAPRNALPLPPHQERAAPLSILGNFNHMFDSKTRREAEKLFSDEVRMNRRLHQLFKYDLVSFAEQTLSSGEILSPHYFEDQNMRVTEFASNRAAVWRSVAQGNLRHAQHDVARLIALARPRDAIRVHAGTHKVMAIRTGNTKRQVYLKPGRFPVPKYIWTVVHDTANNKALAIVVLNDPFVAVSEIRDSVFCESSCGGVAWAHSLRRNRNYESPLYGLAFCCNVHYFAGVVQELPKEVIKDVPVGNDGMLLDFVSQS